jgi:hypothetical protein
LPLLVDSLLTRLVGRKHLGCKRISDQRRQFRQQNLCLRGEAVHAEAEAKAELRIVLKQ